MVNYKATLAVMLTMATLMIPISMADITSWTLNSPDDNTYTNDTTPDFNFTAVSDNQTSFSCTLYLNDTAYGTNASVQNDTATVITANSSLSEAQYNWYINCTDNTTTQSSSRTITIDTTNPTVTDVDSVTDGNAYETATINISYSDTNFDTCNLVWDGTEETFANSDSTNYWEEKGLSQDTDYTVKSFCNDSVGQTTYTSQITITGKSTTSGGGGYAESPTETVTRYPLTISTEPGTVYVTITNEQGETTFSGSINTGEEINIKEGTYTISAEASGYESKDRVVTVDGSKHINIELNELKQSTTPAVNQGLLLLLVLIGIAAVIIYKKY